MQCWGAEREDTARGWLWTHKGALNGQTPCKCGLLPTCLEPSPEKTFPSSGLWNHAFLNSFLLSFMLILRPPQPCFFLNGSPKGYWFLTILSTPHSPDDGLSSPMPFARTSIITYCQDTLLNLNDQPGIFWAWNPISSCPVNVSTYISLNLKLHLSKTKLIRSLAALESISPPVTHLNW